MQAEVGVQAPVWPFVYRLIVRSRSSCQTVKETDVSQKQTTVARVELCQRKVMNGKHALEPSLTRTGRPGSQEGNGTRAFHHTAREAGPTVCTAPAAANQTRTQRRPSVLPITLNAQVRNPVRPSVAVPVRRGR
jgi:hypothetical protein